MLAGSRGEETPTRRPRRGRFGAPRRRSAALFQQAPSTTTVHGLDDVFGQGRQIERQGHDFQFFLVGLRPVADGRGQTPKQDVVHEHVKEFGRRGQGIVDTTVVVVIITAAVATLVVLVGRRRGGWLPGQTTNLVKGGRIQGEEHTGNGHDDDLVVVVRAAGRTAGLGRRRGRRTHGNGSVILPGIKGQKVGNVGGCHGLR